MGTISMPGSCAEPEESIVSPPCRITSHSEIDRRLFCETKKSGLLFLSGRFRDKGVDRHDFNLCSAAANIGVADSQVAEVRKVVDHDRCRLRRLSGLNKH